MIDLFSDERQSICLISENSQHSSNYYHSDNALILENEKLKLALTHKDELLAQKDEQITKIILNTLVFCLFLIYYNILFILVIYPSSDRRVSCKYYHH